MSSTPTTGPTPSEHPGRGRTRAERVIQRVLRRTNRRGARHALPRTRRPSPSPAHPTSPATPGSWAHPRPFTSLTEQHAEIKQHAEIEHEPRQAMHLRRLRLIMFTILVGLAFAIVVSLLITAAPHPADTASAHTATTRIAVKATTATVRPVAWSTTLGAPTPATATPHDISAPATSAAPRRASDGLPAGRAAVPFAAGDGELEGCGHRSRARIDSTPTDSDRPLLVHAGPINVSLGLDVAARRVCHDRARRERADAHRSGDRDRDSNRKDRNRDRNGREQAGCTCASPHRNGSDQPQDTRDWPDSREGYRPAPSGYDPTGYYPRPSERHDPPVCHTYRPGEHPDLPDGGTVCITRDHPPR